MLVVANQRKEEVTEEDISDSSLSKNTQQKMESLNGTDEKPNRKKDLESRKKDLLNSVSNHKMEKPSFHLDHKISWDI